MGFKPTVVATSNLGLIGEGGKEVREKIEKAQINKESKEKREEWEREITKTLFERDGQIKYSIFSTSNASAHNLSPKICYEIAVKLRYHYSF